MARKNTPQPLTLAESTNITADSFEQSPLSPVSPRSPRSPFSKFSATARKLHSQQQVLQSDQQHQLQKSVPAAETQPSRITTTTTTNTTLPASQTPPSLSSQKQQQQQQTPIDKQEKDRPSRGGFFSNYKASKSSGRLQDKAEARQVQEDSMSRDTDGAGLAGVSSKDKPRSGMNFTFRSSALIACAQQTNNHLSLLQNPAEIDP